MEIRAGLHSGECVLREGDVQGIAVHIASRISEMAEDGEVLISGTVRDLSVGSDIRLRDRGVQTLKGVDGEWRTYSVENS
jgi:class 3 adenylate cyclase